MLGNKHTRRAALTGAALTIGWASPFAAFASRRDPEGAGLEAASIRTTGVETARVDYQGRHALQATALENAPGLDRLVVLDTRRLATREASDARS